MHPNEHPFRSEPANNSGHADYFFTSGLYRLYLSHYRPGEHNKPDRVSTRDAPMGAASAPVAQGNSALHEFERPLTVEQIVAHGYFAAPASKPEHAVIGDKRHTAWLGLDDVIAQIRSRHQLYEQAIYEIELSKCDALSAIFALEAYRGSMPANGRGAYAMNKALQGLYKEQREERLSLWQDVSKLKQSLPEWAKEYLGAYRKLAILSDITGGEQP